MRRINLALCLVLLLPALLRAETDGNELLEMMQHPKGREAAQPFIDDVWLKWNNGLFCIPEENIRDTTFAAVLDYLENNPENLFRPRRYLIVQGLRAGFPCIKE
ncbi:MAG TPA: hypothetical protein DEO41_03680 [Betaproteobacteria bacterium]|jgi:hypothetical protein|nr:hypothetical protein [Betaproteobacteria bacterium]